MAKIGIFWVHGGLAFGKAVDLRTGVEGIPGIVDSPDNHADVWEHERPWMSVSLALSGVEYHEVPRGRVLSKHGQPLVYADKTLLNASGKLIISRFFGFAPEDALWLRDAHYTTSRAEIDQFFTDDTD